MPRGKGDRAMGGWHGLGAFICGMQCGTVSAAACAGHSARCGPDGH